MRKTPYTAEGIKRVACFRCGAKPSAGTWQVCADGNQYRAVCHDCDVALNRVVLKWMRDPNVATKLARYKGAQPVPA